MISMENNPLSFTPDQKEFFDLLTEFQTKCIDYGKAMNQFKSGWSGFSVSVPMNDSITKIGQQIMAKYREKK